MVSYHQPILSLDLVNVNTPLIALEIRKQTPLLPQHIKGLNFVILHQPHPLTLIFQCHPNPQQFELSLNTAKSVIELLTIIHNNTHKVLRLKIDKDKKF